MMEGDARFFFLFKGGYEEFGFALGCLRIKVRYRNVFLEMRNG